MKKVEKMVSVKFEGQLAGDTKKEKWFSSLREELKIVLPEVGEEMVVKLNPSKLDGAFLSCLDGSGALKIDGVNVYKTKVYSGEEKIPSLYALSFKIKRVSGVSCKLSAELISK